MHGRTSVKASCACGGVVVVVEGPPIVGVTCYCDDCQLAARRLEERPHAPPVADADGGTELQLYRKDRLRIEKGAEQLQAFRLKQASATKRMAATCCDTAMFIAFDRGPHWVSVYRSRFAGELPPIDMCIQTRFRRADAPALPGSPPHFAKYPFGLIGKLVASRIAMLLGP